MLDVECRLPWLQMQFMMQKRFATFQSLALAAITWLLPTPELHVPFRLNTFHKFYAANGCFQWRLTRQPTGKPLGLMFAFGTIRTMLWKTFIWLLSHLLVGTLTWPRSRCLRNCLTLSGPLWKDKLIGCSTDMAANMIGRLSGLVTRIQNVVKPNFMRMWCLLHQIDIIMQKVYKRVGCNFYKTLTSIISFLRRQKNLVEEMQAICPNLSATRWASMSRVTRFLVEKRSEIVTYFTETEPSDRFDQLPTHAFWILISIISEISTHVSECVESLQGQRVTLQQQTATVQSLLDSL